MQGTYYIILDHPSAFLEYSGRLLCLLNCSNSAWCHWLGLSFTASQTLMIYIIFFKMDDKSSVFCYSLQKYIQPWKSHKQLLLEGHFSFFMKQTCLYHQMRTTKRSSSLTSHNYYLSQVHFLIFLTNIFFYHQLKQILSTFTFEPKMDLQKWHRRHILRQN